MDNSTRATAESLRLEFVQTGDPWHDWGLCELYDILRQAVWPEESNANLGGPDRAGFAFEGKMTPQEFADAVHAVLASAKRWNDLHPRFEEGKRVVRCAPSSSGGRRIPGEKYDPKITEAEWTAAGCRGTLPKLVRNRCQRMASLPMTPAKLAELLAMHPGPNSIHHLAIKSALGAESDITQSANPAAGKHHSNTKVRGPASANSAGRGTAVFVLACICTSLSAWKPFTKDEDCTVYLPENLPFPVAHELWKQLVTGGVLVHPDDPAKGEMYRNLPLRADGEEAQLLVLLHAMQSSLALHKEGDGLFERDIVHLSNWAAIHFSSAKNVSVGAIRRILIPGRVFPLLRPINAPLHWKSEQLVEFVPDCLVGLRIESARIQCAITKALLKPNARDTWKYLVDVCFFMYKNTRQAKKSTRRAAGLLPHFVFHFGKEMLIMNEDLLTACRNIGELIGSVFNSDVTLLSRLHNSATSDDLRANLDLVSFRLFKVSNAGQTGSGLWRISPQEFSIVVDSGEEHWRQAAQTISMFASLTAFNKNLNNETEGA